MRLRRFLLASVVLFVVSLAWNAAVHLVVLRAADDSVRHLWRPDLSSRMWISLLQTAALMCLFVLGYTRFARSGTIREGTAYGLCFAALAGLLVDVNQYVLYPLPGSVVAQWFVAGALEFVLYGILVTRLYR